MMVTQAMWLRNLLGLPEKDTWIDEEDQFQISDAGETQTFFKDMGGFSDSCCSPLCYYIADIADSKDDDDKKSEKRGGAAAKEERRGSRSRFKDVNKGESKSATSEKSLEVKGK